MSSSRLTIWDDPDEGSNIDGLSQGDRIVVTPIDPANGPAVEKVLTEAKLNAYALNPRTMCVRVPPVSGEQRDESAG